MNVFELRDQLIIDYADYIKSFIKIKDPEIEYLVENELEGGVLWPDPLIQLNPSFELGESIDQLVDQEILHSECSQIFRIKKNEGLGKPIQLYKHQAEAIKIAHGGHNYILTTGTGSGKSLAYIVPIVNHVLDKGSGKGIQAIIVYPMNALANSQFNELEKFICTGYPAGKELVKFERYTGQEDEEKKEEIVKNPPDILLTNYVMLELILTRPYERDLISAAKGLKFLVLDELHTYRGRQGADVSLLVRRLRDRLEASELQHVGTSATLAGTGPFSDQQVQVARVASKIFGSVVYPDHVIGETLKRTSDEPDLSDPVFKAQLTDRISDPDRKPPVPFKEFIADPLSRWIESVFGITKEPDSDRLIRCQPMPITGELGAASKLSKYTGISIDRCAEAIKEGLLGGYYCEPKPVDETPVFAFRLHQFISRGDTVYTTIDSEEKRHITVQGQQFVPNDRHRLLYPMVFCRECGQEYYSVRKTRVNETGEEVFWARYLMDRDFGDADELGFLYFSSTNPWPDDMESILEKIPDDWIEDDGKTRRIRKYRKKDLPKTYKVGPDGRLSPEGVSCQFVGSPIIFCLNCGVSYSFRGSDFARLASLGAGGRSSATTILSISTIRNLARQPHLEREAKKLLSFTDNRQDASLQAGHFNDFIEIGIIRAALYLAVKEAGTEGLQYDRVVQKVYEALDLPKELYASDPDVRYNLEKETNKALRNVIGYRLYRDLKRGWRVNLPNLEQCDLLKIEYASLAELCQNDKDWVDCHPALSLALPDIRFAISKVLLDFMRRSLAIKVSYLESDRQEQIQQQSFQRLIDPWAIDEDEHMEHSSILFPRSKRKKGDFGGNVFLSSRGKFGRYLARVSTFPEYTVPLKLEDRQTLILDLLRTLQKAGLVEKVKEPKKSDDVPGYQMPASAILWKAGFGESGFYDPLSTPNAPSTGGSTNEFFKEYYGAIALGLTGLRGLEHTAQVSYDDRQDREKRFRAGDLQVLFCSPTMELGVDIADLNTVNLRNIPPTPANYAQRSGRAGRGGQPALVFAYCTAGNSHDQYFFKRPELMVAGAVSPPRLDIANEDLVRAHVHAIWLAETRQDLGKSLKTILDLSGDDPSLKLLDSVLESLRNSYARQNARQRAANILSSIQAELQDSDWYSDTWVDECISHAELNFDAACDRWRSLYRAAHRQAKIQGRIIRDASRSHQDQKRAERLRREAEAQLRLLRDEAARVFQSDFYSYRYFASEGFLPGYNFPRLPLSAFIPGRRGKRSQEDFLTRPRFLAIYEFGPQAVVYHEGSRYMVNKVILPPTEKEELPLFRAKLCPACGYLHPMTDSEGQDKCEHCKAFLGAPFTQLFRLQNVATRRRDKINADEEERLRLGYELKTGFRFSTRNGRPTYRTAAVLKDNETLADLSYGNAATLWRINLGWIRRKKGEIGFLLDMERGYWSKRDSIDEKAEGPDTGQMIARVIPYVEDRRNCLIYQPRQPMEPEQMASLQAALKNAIQVRYQLEDNELAAEPLPEPDDRQMILLYESAEGGAGVLRHFVDDPLAVSEVAVEALRICHFDPVSGNDEGSAPNSRERCEAACYDCLLSYSNQREHPLLDRHVIKDVLMELKDATISASPAEKPRAAHFSDLKKQCDSELERLWLDFLEASNLYLPSHAQHLISACSTRPDFFYAQHQAAIYIDGPIHDFADRHERDREQTECMEDLGYLVIRFHHREDWEDKIARFPNIFGRIKP